MLLLGEKKNTLLIVRPVLITTIYEQSFARGDEMESVKIVIFTMNCMLYYYDTPKTNTDYICIQIPMDVFFLLLMRDTISFMCHDAGDLLETLPENV